MIESEFDLISRLESLECEPLDDFRYGFRRSNVRHLAVVAA